MKVCVILLSLAALTSAAPSGLQTHTLQDDLKDFIDILPQEQIAEINLLYLSCDRELRAIVAFVQSDEFWELYSTYNDIPEVQELHQYLRDTFLGPAVGENSSLQVASDLSARGRAAGDTAPNCDQPITGGVSGLFKDIASILPFDKIKALFVVKMQTSPQFRSLVARLKSPELKSLIQRLKANPEYQQLVLKVKVDIEALIDQAETLIAVSSY